MQTRQAFYVQLTRDYTAVARSQKSKWLAAQAAALGMSTHTLRRNMRDLAGYVPERKTRSDKGCTKVSDDSLAFVAAIQREAVRKNGKRTLRLPVAKSIATANGVALPVGTDQLGRLLKARHMSVDQTSKEGAHVSMRAEHPNHVHQVDPSLCVVYYMNDEQYIMTDDAFYKNKLENYAKVKFKVWRYTIWDAASSAIKVRYVEAAGENQRDLIEFLLWAWIDEEARVPYGVPRMLSLDPGAAMKAFTVRSLCAALGVELNVHKPGAARVSGGVEGSQNIVETQFECRLKFEPVDSVEQLNRAAEAWARLYNANAIEGQDTRLSRGGRIVGARRDLWMLINESQMRFLPPLAVCRALAEGKPQQRKVSNRLTVQYTHPMAQHTRFYSVKDMPGVVAGQDVEITPLIYPLGECKIRVRVERYDGEALVYDAAPEAERDRFGQLVDAPIWGQSYASLPRTVADEQRAKLDELAFPGLTQDERRQARAKSKTPMVRDGKTLVAHSHLQKMTLTDALPRRGSTIETPDYATVAPAPPMTHFAACRALAKSLGRALSVEESERVQAWYPDGVREADLATLSTCIESGTTPFNAVRKTGTA